MDVSTTLFSIIVPFYNADNTLERCVQSLVNQTYKNIEIVLVNDGSTDGSGDIAQYFRSSDQRVHVFQKQNGGVSDARNYGIRHSSGEYLLFVDSDDEINLNTCQMFFDCIAANKPVILDAVRANVCKISSTGKKEMKFTQTKNGVVSGSEFFVKQIKSNSFRVYVTCYVFRREYIVNNDLFFPVGLIHEDAVWTPRALILAARVAMIDACFYSYYSREGSISRGEDQLVNAIHIIKGCQILNEFANSISDMTVRLALNDLIVRQYLAATVRGRLHMQKNKKFQCKNLLSLRVLTLKTYIKKNICNINVALYVTLYDIYVWFSNHLKRKPLITKEIVHGLEYSIK